MSAQTFYYLQITSTFSVALPLMMAFIQFKSLNHALKCFAFFLIVGLATDLCGWYCFLTKNEEANLYIRNIYDLFEAVFLTWFISRLSDKVMLTKILLALLPALCFFWAARFVYVDTISWFKSSTQVLLAFTSSYCILQLIEKAPYNFSRLIAFWTLLGIFFYCFSTYFIMGLLLTKLSKVWYLHNFINITTNLIYFVGFTRALPSRGKSPSATF